MTIGAWRRFKGVWRGPSCIRLGTSYKADERRRIQNQYQNQYQNYVGQRFFLPSRRGRQTRFEKLSNNREARAGVVIRGHIERCRSELPALVCDAIIPARSSGARTAKCVCAAPVVMKGCTPMVHHACMHT